ncbi:TPA: hypothetical protein N0F65_012571, partial [Lagenidium giganteum]
RIKGLPSCGQMMRSYMCVWAPLALLLPKEELRRESGAAICEWFSDLVAAVNANGAMIRCLPHALPSLGAGGGQEFANCASMHIVARHNAQAIGPSISHMTAATKVAATTSAAGANEARAQRAQLPPGPSAAVVTGRRSSKADAVSGAQSKQDPPRRRKCRVNVDVSACRYAIIKRCLRERGFRLYKKRENAASKWDMWWSDRGELLKELPRLNPFQKINHFPSMEEICRKDFLANNLNGIAKVLPEEFAFYPRSFLIPAESVELQKAMESGPKNATYIVKPRTLCQGKGISLIQSYSKLPPNEPCVVQRYVDNPLLIDGFKFDLRIYVLVYSVLPLKLYIFRNGLARFCTSQFKKPTRKNLNQKRMHLTNYAINKKSASFQQATSASGDNKGSKRSLASVMKYLDDSGQLSSKKTWHQICDIVIKTLISIQPKLAATYKSFFNGGGDGELGPKCFEILGFDIMLDTMGKAWLFEVNHAPSFAGDSPLDKEIKTALINATLDIVGVTNDKKRDYQRKCKTEWSKRLWTANTCTRARGRAGIIVPPTSSTAGVTNGPPEAALDDPKISQANPDQESSSDDDPDQDCDSGNSETDDDATKTQAPRLDPLIQPLGHTNGNLIRNVLRKRNRVCPSEASERTPSISRSNSRVFIDEDLEEFGNQMHQIYPLRDRHDCSHPLQQLYERVHTAAEVNRSKLWN